MLQTQGSRPDKGRPGTHIAHSIRADNGGAAVEEVSPQDLLLREGLYVIALADMLGVCRPTSRR
jgi:hypothetical protein